MAHEINFLVATGGDFYGTNKPDISLGVDVLSELALVNAMTEKSKRIGI